MNYQLRFDSYYQRSFHWAAELVLWCVIQVLFLILAFVENLVLLSLGLVWLKEERYDNTFKIISAILCTISYLTGVILHAVYYRSVTQPSCIQCITVYSLI